MADLSSAQIIIGSASNRPSAVSISGNASLSNTGVLTISSGAIQTSMIASGAVTATELATNAVTNIKLINGAVSTEKILDANVSLAKMADLSSAQIIIGSASNRPSAVSISGNASLSNTGVLTISANAIQTSMIAAGAVTNTEIADNAVSTAEIANQAVTSNKILLDVTTTVLLGNAAISSINNDNKFTYKMVYASDDRDMYIAQGSLSTSPWIGIRSNVAITPV
jgi:hypothetical protein